MTLPAVLTPHQPLKAYYAHESSKRGFIRKIFDDSACDYDYIEKILSFGSGSWYRRAALSRAGLTRGMKVLDVAVGTGLVAREAIGLSGQSDCVLGLDPSPGMIQHAVRSLKIQAIIGIAEHIPLGDRQFDFLSMGYAFRHLSDVHRAFAEFFRVLKPGGKICLLEITSPRGAVRRWCLRAYMQGIIPFLTRMTTGRARSQKLWRYYWDTIEACVAPEVILKALQNTGFTNPRQNMSMGIFSEYTATKPA